MRFIRAFLLLGLMIAVNLAFAQSAAHDEAEKLLNSINMETTMKRSIEQMLDLQVKQNPPLVPYRHIMLEFLNKYMSYTILMPELINLYVSAFSESELKEINAFYQTPTGQKAIKTVPDLMRRGAQIGVQRVQENIQELKQMITEEKERLAQQQGEKEKEAK